MLCIYLKKGWEIKMRWSKLKTKKREGKKENDGDCKYWEIMSFCFQFRRLSILIQTHKFLEWCWFVNLKVWEKA